MAIVKNSDIPENKFNEVTIGNNGVKITISEPIGKDMAKVTNLYLRADDIRKIYSKFIEPMYTNEAVEVAQDDFNSDEIMDANY